MSLDELMALGILVCGVLLLLAMLGFAVEWRRFRKFYRWLTRHTEWQRFEAGWLRWLP